MLDLDNTNLLKTYCGAGSEVPLEDHLTTLHTDIRIGLETQRTPTSMPLQKHNGHKLHCLSRNTPDENCTAYTETRPDTNFIASPICGKTNLQASRRILLHILFDIASLSTKQIQYRPASLGVNHVGFQIIPYQSKTPATDYQ